MGEQVETCENVPGRNSSSSDLTRRWRRSDLGDMTIRGLRNSRTTLGGGGGEGGPIKGGGGGGGGGWGGGQAGPYLPAKHMEVVGRRRHIDHLHKQQVVMGDT